MIEFYISDEDALKSNESYTAKDYKKYENKKKHIRNFKLDICTLSVGICLCR